ncbi:hypothetical protein, partial [Williamsia phyllosphaerae]|uniref:hypothetical protein n=1 Tax=Williamsia phyllosphaerae TaxID=885042 RepID=UPI00166A1895
MNELAKLVATLRSTGGCGTFPSGSRIEESLAELGVTANEMTNRLSAAIDEYKGTVVGAGRLITRQEFENEHNVRTAENGSSDAPSPFGILPGQTKPSIVPNGPSLADQLQASTNTNVLDVPCVPGNTAGTFTCSAAPEDVSGLTLDQCVQHLTPAVAAKLTMLAQQWEQLGADLTNAINIFHRIVQTKMLGGTWTGKSGPAVATAADKLTQTTVQISAQASANGAAILAWAGSLGDTKSRIEQSASARTSAMAASPPESRAAVQNQADVAARLTMMMTYNPAVTAIATGLSNLTDPSSPVTGVPLVIGGPPGSGPGGSGSGGSGTSGATSGGGGGGGGTGGGASTAPANKSATDAAKTLTRQGTGDPAAAASNASKNAAAQSGQGNPASAAQSAMSKAGDTAKGLGGKSGA